MYKALEEGISKADPINVIEPNEVSLNSNYLGISDKIGPMPELGGGNILRVTMSSGPIDRIPGTAQTISSKPSGFWYACNNEWLEWLKYEMPQWIGKYIYAVELNEDRVLKITNEREFSEFERNYKPSERDDPSSAYSAFGSLTYIDWPKVAEEYGGIEICPYMFSKRNSSMWYCPWDVASGCIWNPSAIKSLKLISQTKDDQKGVAPEQDDPTNWEWRG
jgi:hypothetical protein